MIDKKEENIIILFDEQGTPTFIDMETNIFLGVAVAYNINIEDKIFIDCSNDFNLSNKKMLKNNRISSKRALRISNVLSKLNLDIVVGSIDLQNPELQSVVSAYEKFGNTLRRVHRNIRGRPIAQILHKELFDFVFYKIVNNQIDKHPFSTRFSVYLDDWAFPVNDILIELETSSSSFEKKINEVNMQDFPEAQVKLDNFKLLNVDSQRKRFIDVIASVISRKYLAKDNAKYFTNKELNQKIDETDITRATIEDINFYMENIS